MTLENKIAIVTGAAMGIGGAIARRLAADGAKVLVADILPDAAAENAARIEEAGGTASTWLVDISQPQQIRPMIERAVELWGGLHFLVNNAWGTEEPDGSALTLTETAFDRALKTSQKAVYLSAKFGVPHIQASGGGSIVNISSVHGQLVSPQSLAYEMTKAAIIAMSRQMAVDFGPLGVRVNCICPGHIVTERGAEHWKSNPSLLSFFDQQYPCATPACRTTSPAQCAFSAPTRPVSSPATPSSSTAACRSSCRKTSSSTPPATTAITPKSTWAASSRSRADSRPFPRCAPPRSAGHRARGPAGRDRRSPSARSRSRPAPL